MRAYQLAFFLSSATTAVGFTSLPTPTASRIGFAAWTKSVHGNGVSQITFRTRLDASTALDKVVVRESPPIKPPFPVVLWRFTRPHTLIGSALAIPAIQIMAAPSFQVAFSAANAIAALYAMLPALLMNLYITGLNQITDVEIDKINKPNLPIAAGIMSMKTAIVTVLVSLILSLSLGVAHPVLGSQGLNVALWGSGILGTMYSLPPFRLKRFPALAAFCIVAVRGTIINAGFFAHARAAAFGVPSATALSCLFGDLKCGLSCLFFGIFGIVIALMKDVPDVRGDKLSNVRTLSVRIGQKRVFHAMRRLLLGLFFAFGAGFFRGAVMAPSALLTWFRGTIGVASVWAGLSVRKEAQGVDPEDPEQVYGFYMHLWKLFYLSYLALPLVR
jgi:homogentisate phytyltransferase / homogentisate geranylgeranyltransferase